MKKLKTTTDALVLDPDLIDLTVIPPPMTPDEDGFNRVFPGAASAVSTPPTPFADRESLEAELKALEKDIDHIQKLKAYNGWATNGSNGKPISADDTLSDGSSINSYNYEDEASAASNSASAAAGIAAVYQLRDIDSFIANVTVPPPPGTFDLSVHNGDLDDISAFIIPPPPLLKSMEDREVHEVKVPTPKIMDKEKISPKIASIQQKFLSNHQDTLTRKKPVAAPLAPPPPPEHNLPPPPPPPRSSIPSFPPKRYEFGGAGAPAPPRPTKLTLDAISNPPPPPVKTLSKMSLTSSSDSLSSNASVNTVKSVSPTKSEAPPSLPPRQSPSKSPSRPPLASPEDMVSPPSVASKPVVPSRASKPSLSPNKEMRALPPVPSKSNSSVETTPEKSSTPPSLPPLLMTKSSHITNNSPVRKIIDSMEVTNEDKPKLPSKTAIGGRKLPAPPPNSTQPPPPPKLTNGVNHKKTKTTENGYKMEVYTNSHFDHEGGTSVDDSDCDEDESGSPPKTKFILGPPVGESNDYDESEDSNNSGDFGSRNFATFHKAEGVLQKVLQHIDEAHGLCNLSDSNKVGLHKSKDAYSKAKEQLTNESRQFVTASKLFVKSATESEGQLVDCLNHCVVMIDKIGLITLEVARQTPTPMQTQSLIVKVRDVADTFLQAVLAAGNATGRDMNDPAMSVLMKKATNLASVLTTLMRSLRVFN